MTYISDIFVIHHTSGRRHAKTDAGFDLIVRGPGYEAAAAFEDLNHDERETGRTDQYRFIFDEPFNWDPATWTVSMRMRTTRDGWLPRSIFIIGKGAEDIEDDWVLLGAHYAWPKDTWFDRAGEGARDNTPEHVISGFTWNPLSL